MFRRRRRVPGKHASASGSEATAAEESGQQGESGTAASVPSDRPTGPWDEEEPAPELARVDLGSLRVPVAQSLEVQLNMLHEEVVAATLRYAGSALQLQAFAAPKSGGLWAEARQEIAGELRDSGSQVVEVDGPFGSELRAELPGQPDTGTEAQPARFVGVDGPRWLLRGVFTGPAGRDPAQAQLLHEALRGTVVVRGEAPMPARERLPLQVPPDAQGGTTSAEPGDGPPHSAGGPGHSAASDS